MVTAVKAFMGCPASKPAASAQKIVPYVGQVLSPLANSSRVLHNTTCFLNAWKIQTHPLAACPRVTMDAIIAPTASEGLDAEVRQASRRLLSLEELMGQQQGAAIHAPSASASAHSWFICVHPPGALHSGYQFLCLFWSSFFLRGSRRPRRSAWFTTLLLQGGTAFLHCGAAGRLSAIHTPDTYETAAQMRASHQRAPFQNQLVFGADRRTVHHRATTVHKVLARRRRRQRRRPCANASELLPRSSFTSTG